MLRAISTARLWPDPSHLITSRLTCTSVGCGLSTLAFGDQNYCVVIIDTVYIREQHAPKYPTVRSTQAELWFTTLFKSLCHSRARGFVYPSIELTQSNCMKHEHDWCCWGIFGVAGLPIKPRHSSYSNAKLAVATRTTCIHGFIARCATKNGAARVNPKQQNFPQLANTDQQSCIWREQRYHRLSSTIPIFWVSDICEIFKSSSSIVHHWLQNNLEIAVNR